MKRLATVVLTAIAVSATLAPTTPALAAAEPTAAVSRVASPSTIEKQILSLVNVERRKRGCVAVKSQANLRKAALTHTKKMAAAKKMSHRLPGEKTLGKRITAAGYKNWRMVGENVAVGFPTAESVMSAWMKSPGHRRNILNCTYRHLGVAVVNSNGTHWYTQNFGRK